MSFQNLAMVIAGCLIGTFIGMLPGLGLMSIIAIMINIAISMGDPSAPLILLARVYYVAIFGGSTSSILLNAQGVTETVASSFDGYPMAQQGQVAKAMIMTVHGLIMATAGEGALFNLPSFAGGIMNLQSGLGFITLAMAIFALPKALFLVLKPKVAGTANSEIKDMRITRAIAPVLRPPVDPRVLYRRLVGGRGDDRQSFGLCGGTQPCDQREASRVWQGIDQGPCAPRDS